MLFVNMDLVPRPKKVHQVSLGGFCPGTLSIIFKCVFTPIPLLRFNTFLLYNLAGCFMTSSVEKSQENRENTRFVPNEKVTLKTKKMRLTTCSGLI